MRVDILYNAAGQPLIPAAGVAHVSGNSPAQAGTGYDRNWPAGRACRHPGCVPNDGNPGILGRAPNMHPCPNISRELRTDPCGQEY
ncbi:hypothetical protein ARTHRO9AX_120010 [Arthrobacter sp. 9AX]|nr:hypothetical protein ARTHRO9AX_120010 [Arthrobacter sp. 9AX]